MEKVTINSKTFNKKSQPIQQLILESLYILSSLGIPIDTMGERQKEKMAMALLAVGDVKKSKDWKKIKTSNDTYSLTTRDIIGFHNKNLEEHISSGSYDDIRRKDLKPLILAEIVLKSKENSNNSDPTRGYKVNIVYARIIKNFGQSDWDQQVAKFNASHKTLAERLSSSRPMEMLKVQTPDGKEIKLVDGEHNLIQKEIIESLLPRYGNNAVVLYCGDANNKYGVIYEKEEMKKIGFEDLKQSILPDIVAYSYEKDWIYLIEAYHTSNPITPERKLQLKQMLGEENYKKAVFITAFENIAAYKSCPEELAWETEVWIATDPDHMIHRNGKRFMGPYNS